MVWYWSGAGVHWWWWLFTFFVTVVFWALVITLIISVVRTFLHGHSHGPSQPEDPERALARRFANGEIDEEEFHRRLDVLRSHARNDQR